MQLIDSHAHLTSPELLPHLEQIIARAQAAGVKNIINICTDRATLEAGIQLHERHPWIFNAGATTPHDVDQEGNESFEIFSAAALKKQLIAIGETGLDYYYKRSEKSAQQEFLIRYLHLATQCQLPVIFHCREAFDDLYSITDREYPKNAPAILHCFTGSIDEAKRAIDRGWMISFSGIITFKNSGVLRDVVRFAPIENILIETDTPYLAPLSQRGKPNEPAFIGEIASCIAAVKDLSLLDVAEMTTENVKRVYKLTL